MSRTATRPPRGAELLLESVLAHCLFGPDLVGDLAERHALDARRSTIRAGLAYWGSALALFVRFAPSALGAALGQLVVPRGPGRAKENPVSQTLFDLRLSLRGLVKRPGPSLLVVATLAVGLGANAAVFGILDALVIHPFPFEQSDRLVLLSERTSTSDEYDKRSLSPATFLELRDESRGLLESLVGYDGWSANLLAAEGPERIQGARTSPELLQALRLRPALGRYFSAAESAPGGEKVVVLGHTLWKRKYGGDPSILGRTIEIDGASHRVVGVAPVDFLFPNGAELWAPLVFTPGEAARREVYYLGAFGRLAEGVSLESAAARFAEFGERRAALHPDTDKHRETRTETLAVGLRDSGAVPIFVLWQAAGFFVLFIGWLNVANLVLARGQERQRELALLDALGAGRGRLLRLQLTEGLLLGAMAALLALPLAAVGQKVMRDSVPVTLRRYLAGWDQIGLDWSSTAFTFALAVVTIVAVSAWPAMRALRASAKGSATLLREGGRSGSAGRRRQRGRSLLIVAEIAAALALTVAAGLTIRASNRVVDGPQGYDPDGLVTFKVALPEERYVEPEARRAFTRDALSRLAEISGVESVASANVFPASGNNTSRAIVLAGEPEPEPNQAPKADLRTVGGDYFATLRMPIVAGRALAPSDDENAPRVAVVSRAMATKFWPDRDPIGQRFRTLDKDDEWITVVGISGDHLHHWFGRRNAPTFFVPAAQSPSFSMAFALRTSRTPEGLEHEIRREISAVDALQPIAQLWSQRAQIRETTVGPRIVAGVMSVFAVLSLILAVSGVYGVMAYRVSLETQEIGVRVALGATAGDVLRSTVGKALRLAAVGIAIGFAASAGVGRVLGSVLRGIAGFELPVVLGSCALLAAAALAAALIPARRALAMHPADVLRAE